MQSLKHAENEVIQVPLDHVHPDEAQARKNFDPRARFHLDGGVELDAVARVRQPRRKQLCSIRSASGCNAAPARRPPS
jgi:hypothetical protein